MPAEWEPQQALWLAWPHQLQTWPGRFESIPPWFAAIARLIAESTPVRILATDALQMGARKLVGPNSNIEFVDIATNDCWIRDYGPSFVIRSDTKEQHAVDELCAVDWDFNAWGGKYEPYDQDNAAAKLIANHAGIKITQGPLCVEGGGMETDGSGRMLINPDCLIDPARNKDLTAERATQILHQYLGITEIVWVDGGGLEGDDTDGHIDQLARFVSPTDVVVAVSDNPNDPNQPGLEDNYRQLHLWGDATKPGVTVHRLPIPPQRTVDGQRVPESYCNFLMLGRQRLLVPTFGHPPSDDRALGILGELAGPAEVIPVACQEMVWGLGAIHCASRDQPAI